MININVINENDLCIACGACIYSCPAGNLEIRFNDFKGLYEPCIIDNEKCLKNCSNFKVAPCLTVCPSNKIDYFDLSELKFGNKPNTSLGEVDRIFLAQSKNEVINRNSSSGGIIKEVLKYYVNEVPDISIVALRQDRGLKYTPQNINCNEIEKLPGSIYHNIDFSVAIKLLRTNRKSILVANPCQLDGILKYIKEYDPDLLDRLYRIIGLICGWTYNHHSIKAISQYKKIKFNDLDDIAYRGDGPIGKLKLFQKNGKQIKVNRRLDLHYMCAFDRSFNLNRCNFCVNHGNFLADLVVGDAWLPSTVFTTTGISLLISRNKAVTDDLLKMKNDEIISLLEANIKDVVESQTHRVVYGDFSYAYAGFLKQQGKYAPEFNGPNKNESKPLKANYLRKFQKNYTRKNRIQREGKYWVLFFRKYSYEIVPFVRKYLNWFGVRILRLKSIAGVREEISSDKFRNFR